jgi:branched-chain amino acid transport system permease protein
VGQLPYGLQKRVDLGRALAMEPQVLLLDEPMAGMNVEEKQDMCRFVLDVNDEFGTTVVLIEHDMGVVMDISDRVVVLDYGKKIGDGTPDEVRNNPDVIKAYLGTSHTGLNRWGFFFETLLGGLMAGMLYSLVALGFVLIFKASGVFNFAQGAMVLFAALAMARFAEWIPSWTGINNLLLANVAAFVIAGAIMFVVAWADRVPGAAPPGQPGRRDPADGHAGHRLLPRRPGPDPVRQQHLQDRHRHAQGPIFVLESAFQGGILINKEDLIAALIAAVLVAALSVFFQKTATGRALRAVADDHQAAQSIGIPLNRIWVIVWCVAGVVALVAGMIWGSKLGVQFSLATVALRALPVVILGGLTSVPGAIIGGLIIGVGEKLSEVYIGPLVGGGIEIWFAYVLALGFLLFRPQGLFGEKIIDRV